MNSKDISLFKYEPYQMQNPLNETLKEVLPSPLLENSGADHEKNNTIHEEQSDVSEVLSIFSSLNAK
jgi:hypothetical protein